MTWANVKCATLTCREPIYVTTQRAAELRRSNATFYCIWGHQNWYKPGGSAEDELRQERDRLKQEAARTAAELAAAKRHQDLLRDQRDSAERRVSAAKGRITKMKKREAEGVCPCCDAKFMNLRQHMLSKHPDHATEEVVMAKSESE